ncbi:4Fe-4S ferredoxin iron-sulfur binding domain protein [Bacillus thuringiensis MC28]|nr:4Fe-4S ferredoxin iron-sulfur binding domain protein [Bacillus thuringiensis MC28]
MADAPKLQGTEKLGESYYKINMGIDNANEALKKSYNAESKSSTAINIASTAGNTASTAVNKAESVQKQLDTIVVNGDSSVEAAQARTDVKGETSSSLKLRLDKEQIKTENLSDRLKYIANADNPLIIATYDGYNQTTHPKVVYFENGWNGWKYWMAHTPYPFSNDKYENPSISVSNDGISWTDPKGLLNPIDQPTADEITDKYHMSDTHLLFVNGKLECWYRFNKNGVIDQILRKTTTDGITWSTREVMYTLSGWDMALSPAIVHDGFRYKMWYITGNFEIKYTESDSGFSWGPLQNVTIKTGSKSYRAWHLDVIQEGRNYELLLAAGDSSLPLENDRKELLHGVSVSPTYFELESILKPTPAESGKWDNYYLYRSCILKIGTHYKIFYAAMNQLKRWHIGLSESDDIKKLTGFISNNMDGDIVNVNDIVLNKGNKYYMSKTKASYVDSKEIKLVEEGVSGVRVRIDSAADTVAIMSDDGKRNGNIKANKYTSGLSEFVGNLLKLVNSGVSGVRIRAGSKKDTLEIRSDNDSLAGNVEVNYAYVNQLLPQTGDTVIAKGTFQVNDGRLKIVKPGVNGAGIAVGSKASSLQIVDDAGVRFGLLELAGLMFQGGVEVPEVGGAVRYNASTKKHEGYDGVKWNAFY